MSARPNRSYSGSWRTPSTVSWSSSELGNIGVLPTSSLARISRQRKMKFGDADPEAEYFVSPMPDDAMRSLAMASGEIKDWHARY